MDLNHFAIYLKLTQHCKSTILQLKKKVRDFPGGPVVKNPPYNAGDAGSITGQGTKMPWGS